MVVGVAGKRIPYDCVLIACGNSIESTYVGIVFDAALLDYDQLLTGTIARL